MKALYRKYRPCKLSDVVGQEQVTRVLENSLKQGKINHAYLFIGPRGTGKTSVARIFAHEVNNFKYELEDDYVDIVEIDGASNRGIDSIRELREKVAIAPTSGKYKIYIIDEVHMLTKEAFNALLKTLEEPPEHAIFIMATTDAYKVPITITSRAQTYTFKLADKNVMFRFLKSVSNKEGIKIDDGALKIIVKRGGGSFRDSLSLLDQVSMLSGEEITEAIVIKTLGLPEDEKIHELLEGYLSGDISIVTEKLKELLISGIKPETLVEEIINTILEEPKPEFLPLLSKLPEVRSPYAEAKLLVVLTARATKNESVRAVASSSYSRTTVESSLKNNPGKLTITKQGQIQKIEKVETENKIDKPKMMGPLVEESKINGVVNEGGASKNSENRDSMDEGSASGSSDNENVEFVWETFLERVKNTSDAVYSQLLKTKHQVIGSSLELYPQKKIVKSILSRENNKRILVDAMNGQVKITIHEFGESPVDDNKDETLAKISDIMGGEVINDGGGNPFE